MNNKLKEACNGFIIFVLSATVCYLIFIAVVKISNLKFDKLCLNPLNKSFMWLIITSPDDNPMHHALPSNKCLNAVNPDHSPTPSNLYGFAIETNIAKQIGQYDNSCDKYCYFSSYISKCYYGSSSYAGMGSAAANVSGNRCASLWSGNTYSFNYNGESLLYHVDSFKSNLNNENISFRCSSLDCSLKFIKHYNRNYLLIDFIKYNNESNGYYSFIKKEN